MADVVYVITDVEREQVVEYQKALREANASIWTIVRLIMKREGIPSDGTVELDFGSLVFKKVDKK